VTFASVGSSHIAARGCAGDLSFGRAFDLGCDGTFLGFFAALVNALRRANPAIAGKLTERAAEKMRPEMEDAYRRVLDTMDRSSEKTKEGIDDDVMHAIEAEIDDTCRHIFGRSLDQDELDESVRACFHSIESSDQYCEKLFRIGLVVVPPTKEPLSGEFNASVMDKKQFVAACHSAGIIPKKGDRESIYECCRKLEKYFGKPEYGFDLESAMAQLIAAKSSNTTQTVNVNAKGNVILLFRVLAASIGVDLEIQSYCEGCKQITINPQRSIFAAGLSEYGKLLFMAINEKIPIGSAWLTGHGGTGFAAAIEAAVEHVHTAICKKGYYAGHKNHKYDIVIASNDAVDGLLALVCEADQPSELDRKEIADVFSEAIFSSDSYAATMEEFHRRSAFCADIPCHRDFLEYAAAEPISTEGIPPEDVKNWDKFNEVVGALERKYGELRPEEREDLRVLAATARTFTSVVGMPIKWYCARVQLTEKALKFWHTIAEAHAIKYDYCTLDRDDAFGVSLFIRIDPLGKGRGGRTFKSLGESPSVIASEFAEMPKCVELAESLPDEKSRLLFGAFVVAVKRASGLSDGEIAAKVCDDPMEFTDAIALRSHFAYVGTMRPPLKGNDITAECHFREMLADSFNEICRKMDCGISPSGVASPSTNIIFSALMNIAELQ
jgi:hypothetical protein